MKVIAEALVAAGNLVYLVREETMCKDLRRSADRTLAKLHAATDRIIELQTGGSK